MADNIMIFRYIAKEILGEHIFSKFIELKRKEEKAVILYEIKKYYPFYKLDWILSILGIQMQIASKLYRGNR